MLDMYDFQNDVWLCHSFDGTCFNFTAFVSLSTFFLLCIVYEHACPKILEAIDNLLRILVNIFKI